MAEKETESKVRGKREEIFVRMVCLAKDISIMYRDVLCKGPISHTSTVEDV